MQERLYAYAWVDDNIKLEHDGLLPTSTFYSYLEQESVLYDPDHGQTVDMLEQKIKACKVESNSQLMSYCWLMYVDYLRMQACSTTSLMQSTL